MLGVNSTWEQNIVPKSGAVLNSLGDYHACTHNDSVNDAKSNYSMCVMDVLDSTDTYTLVTQVSN